MPMYIDEVTRVFFAGLTTFAFAFDDAKTARFFVLLSVETRLSRSLATRSQL